MSRTSLKIAVPVHISQPADLRESAHAIEGMTSRRVLMLAWCGIVIVVVVAVLWSRPDSMSGSRSGTSSPVVTIGGADEFDLSQSTIPREQIHRGGPAKDGIPAISNPQLVSAADATFLKPEDRVIGVVLNNIARAYPIPILNYHEIVNDHIGDTPIVVTYCPLCDSACVFDRRTPLGEREFGVSGLLYNSNVLMYDRRGKPESLWSQVKTTGVTGPGLEKPLKTLPVELTTWNDWKKRYPASEVLSLDTGHRRDYSSSPYSSYFTTPQLMFPVNHEDNRLPGKTRVLGIWSDKSQMAVPETLFTGKGEDTEFESTLDGLKFTVRYSSESKSLRVVTADSGLNWMYSLWFAWAAFHPQTDIQTLL